MSYQVFVDYFGDLNLKKYKRDGIYTIYAGIIESGLLDTRIVYVVVLSRFTTNLENARLSELPSWVSFQTRTTNDYLPTIPKNVVLPPKEAKQAMQQFLFHSVNRTEFKTDYRSANVPLEVSILNDNKRKNFLQCPDSLNLAQAIETYRCVINAL